MTYDAERWRDNPYDYQGLENLAVSRHIDGLLMDEIDEHVENDIVGLPFVDWELEKRHPDTRQYLWNLSYVLSDCIESDEVGRITRVSYHFGHAVSDAVLGRPNGVGIEAMEAIKPDVGCAELKKSLETSVNDYLGSRPTIVEIIKSFAPDINPTDRYPRLVELVAGSTIMYIDNAVRENTAKNIANCFCELTDGL
jgi:hypothetical protein